MSDPRKTPRLAALIHRASWVDNFQEIGRRNYEAIMGTWNALPQERRDQLLQEADKERDAQYQEFFGMSYEDFQKSKSHRSARIAALISATLTGVDLRTIKADGGHTGTMVACYIPKELAAKLALDGYEKPEDLHLTLAYIPETLEPAQVRRMIVALETLCEDIAPLVGKIGGIGRFSASGTSDGKDVLYASFDCGALPEFREKIVAAVEDRSHGVEISRIHGFTPHITLAYFDSGKELPVSRLPVIDVTLDTLSLVVGEKPYHFKLKGKAD